MMACAFAVSGGAAIPAGWGRSVRTAGSVRVFAMYSSIADGHPLPESVAGQERRQRGQTSGGSVDARTAPSMPKAISLFVSD